jgi:peptide/nickel transport system ATP-binding protein
MTEDMLHVEKMSKVFDISAPLLNRIIERRPKQSLKAVDDISFNVPRGSTFSLVGESGCGKSTVARLAVGLYTPSSGTLHYAPSRHGDKLRHQMMTSFMDSPTW